MYNAVVNDWKDVEHQITFDVRQPKTHEYTMKRLRKFIESILMLMFSGSPRSSISLH